VRVRTTRQFLQKTTVHYFVSPPHKPLTTCDKPKPLISLLNPAGSGDTASCRALIFNEPRAAFYTDNGVKMQNKKAVFDALPGKFSVTICDRMW